MGLMNTLKQKGKKLAVGVALGGALLGAGSAKANTEEIKDNEAKMEQRADNKSEIKDARKKVSYLDEYLAAVERGEDKDEAYRILTLKMADGNRKAAEEMQTHVKEVEKRVGQIGVVAGLGLILWMWGYHKKPELEKIDKKLGALLKSKGIEK